jgi:hypothetical protein
MSLSSTSPVARRFSLWFSPAPAVPERPPLPEDIVAQLAGSYPNNHNYRIKRGKLAPTCRLAVRHHRISALYPKPLTSLLDLSASKGYFVLEAAQRPECRRAMGIDVVDEPLVAASYVRDYLGLDNARFARMRLDLLARRIGEFGGPFQTVLLINTYQYLYFGDKHEPFESHQAIFSAIHKICAGRVIFNNRLEVDHCQGAIQKIAHETGRAGDYRTERVRAAAEEFFTVDIRGRLGRYPFWVLTPR